MRFCLPEFHVVNLFGGTGNLLFQLAQAHKLARKEEKIRVFVVKPSPRGAGHAFEIEDLILSCKHLVLLNSVYSSGIRFLLFVNNRLRIRQRLKHFWKMNKVRFKLLTIHSDYFQNYEDLIGIDSYFLDEINSYLDLYSSNNKRDFDLVLHMRAGDYLLHQQTFGILTEKYYENCLNSIASNLRRKSAIFYDTPSSALLAFSESHKFVLLGPESANSLDLLSTFRSSSACVIANSTLSWWGGLLASKNGAKVFAPRPWHKSLENKFDDANSQIGFQLIDSSYL